MTEKPSEPPTAGWDGPTAGWDGATAGWDEFRAPLTACSCPARGDSGHSARLSDAWPVASGRREGAQPVDPSMNGSEGMGWSQGDGMWIHVRLIDASAPMDGRTRHDR